MVLTYHRHHFSSNNFTLNSLATLYSTVTDLAKFLGLSTFKPFATDK